jgi:hypothetical protein
MSTTSTTTTSSAAKPASSSRAASAKVGTFAIVFSLTAPIIYVVCEMFGLPLFTYHPATNRVDFGWAAGRSGEGPAMYWYGWVVSMLIASTILGWAATFLPERAIRALPLALIWLLPIVVLIPLIWGLKPFWEKGGWL